MCEKELFSMYILRSLKIGEEAALLNNHRSSSTEFLAILALSKNSLIQETGVLLLTVGQTTTSPVCLGLFHR